MQTVEEIEERLWEMLREREIDWDSRDGLDMLEIMLSTEEEFGFEEPDDSFHACKTVRDLADLVFGCLARARGA